MATKPVGLDVFLLHTYYLGNQALLTQGLKGFSWPHISYLCSLFLLCSLHLPLLSTSLRSTNMFPETLWSWVSNRIANILKTLSNVSKWHVSRRNIWRIRGTTLLPRFTCALQNKHELYILWGDSPTLQDKSHKLDFDKLGYNEKITRWVF